ncbi:MAG: hypothetical protein GX146_10460 [Myxococcales bacterium]|nr:hypothetical protein [Myxococcales bacterium]
MTANVRKIFAMGTLLLAASIAACGAAQPEPTTPVEEKERYQFGPEDFSWKPELRAAELTTEVDDKRYRAVGDILTEFSPATPTIYLVGRLAKVPAAAAIEVRWYKDGIPDPMFESEIEGSDSFSFISSFRPAGKRFIPGGYRVRIVVNGTDVGGTEFTIIGKDPLAGGVSVVGLKVSQKINAKTMVPVAPAKQFKSGVKELHATFAVRNAMQPTDVIVRWQRQGEVFSESWITVEGSGRFGANVASPSGMPDGGYFVEVLLNDKVLASQQISVGKAGDNPKVDKLALGLALNNDNMPVKERDSFAAGGVVYCGLRFLDLWPNTVITVEWNRVDSDGETTWHTVRTPVPGGGSGTMGAQWDSAMAEPGKYKVQVYLNDTPVTDKSFTVK